VSDAVQVLLKAALALALLVLILPSPANRRWLRGER
jgi:hypothetical protein